jgi:hypothetical protein
VITLLLPKSKDANVIKHYRPICLLNVVFKIIIKVLMVRLTRVAEKMIHPTQVAFLSSCDILEGVGVLHEVLNELKRTKAQGIVLKLDFEKAYDKVQWSFFERSFEEERVR